MNFFFNVAMILIATFLGLVFDYAAIAHSLLWCSWLPVVLADQSKEGNKESLLASVYLMLLIMILFVILSLGPIHVATYDEQLLFVLSYVGGMVLSGLVTLIPAVRRKFNE